MNISSIFYFSKSTSINTQYSSLWDTLKMMLFTKYLIKWKCICRINWKFWYWFDLKSYRIRYEKIDLVILIQCPFNNTSFDILRSKCHLLPWNPKAVNPRFWLILHFTPRGSEDSYWNFLCCSPKRSLCLCVQPIKGGCFPALVRRVFSRSPSFHHSLRLVIDQIRPKSHPPTPAAGVEGQGGCGHNRRLCTGVVAWVGSSGPVWSCTLSDNSMSSEEPSTYIK